MGNFFDVIVLGGGPAGFTSANRAAEAGLKTAIFEGNKLGGVCLNEGCIPSKSFIHSAKLFSEQNTATCDSSETVCEADITEWVAEKTKAVETLRNGVRGNLRKNKVKIVFSNGTIKNYCDGLSTIVDPEGNEYVTNHLLIATGSAAFIPPIQGVEQALQSGFAVTTSNIFDLEKSFHSLVIIGGGIIGIELAYCFALGGKKVTIIEASDKLGAAMDSDCMSTTENSLVKHGISVHKNAKVTKIGENSVRFTSNDGDYTIDCDNVLVCAGRRPVLNGYGLDIVNPLVENRAIVVDNTLRTNKKGVYAVGDVNGKSMLAHTAYREAEVCVNSIIGQDDSIEYNLIPSVLYGVPEVACVGENEVVLANRGKHGLIKRLPMSYSGRAVAENSAKIGFCKLVFDNNGILKGGFIVGAYASEIILALTVMIAEKATIDKMKKTVYPHPSVAEIIRETLYAKDEQF